jgi:hypothetical protein
MTPYDFMNIFIAQQAFMNGTVNCRVINGYYVTKWTDKGTTFVYMNHPSRTLTKYKMIRNGRLIAEVCTNKDGEYWGKKIPTDANVVEMKLLELF